MRSARFQAQLAATIAAILIPLSGSAAALTTAAATAPRPAPAGRQGDMQCLLLSNAFSKGGTDQKGQQAALAAHFFYLGRVRQEVAIADLPAAIAQSAKTLQPAMAGPTMQACVKEVQSSEDAMQTAGKSLAPPPAPAKPVPGK